MAMTCLHATAVLALLLIVILSVMNYNALTLEYPNEGYFAHLSGRPAILSHRGSRFLHPENTQEAFETFHHTFDTDVIETDVRLTADGHLVMFHDETLERTTDGHGRVREHTLAQLKRLDAGYQYSHNEGAHYPYRASGMEIPTLQEVLDRYIGDARAYFNIEIKDDERAAAEALHAALLPYRERGIEERVVVSSNHCAQLNAFRDLAEAHGMHFASSACETEAFEFLILTWARLAVPYYTYVAPPRFQFLYIPAVTGPIRCDTPLIMDTAHAIGLRLVYWIINDSEQMISLVQRGADGIISDRTDLLNEAYHQLELIDAVPQSLVPHPPARANGWHARRSLPSYYEPTIDSGDVHECFTPFCLALRFLIEYVYAISAALLLLLALALRSCCGGGGKHIKQAKATKATKKPTSAKRKRRKQA